MYILDYTALPQGGHGRRRYVDTATEPCIHTSHMYTWHCHEIGPPTHVTVALKLQATHSSSCPVLVHT